MESLPFGGIEGGIGGINESAPFAPSRPFPPELRGPFPCGPDLAGVFSTPVSKTGYF